MIKFKELSLGTKVVIISVLTSAITAIVLSLVSYNSAKNALQAEAFNKLTAVREIKAQQIEDYIVTLQRQLLTFAKSKTVQNAAIAFNKAESTISPVKNTDNLRRFYSNDFLAKGDLGSINQVFPTDPIALSLQSHYIGNNPNPQGSKHLLNAPNDSNNNTYDTVHHEYHPIIRQYLEEFGYYDIFLVNVNTDTIIYSVFKEVDFATNLNTGPYKKSGIASVYRQAKTLNDGEFTTVDFAPYLPSFNAPASFLATPVYAGNTLNAVLIFQMPVDKINEVMTGHNNWQDTGLGKTGETYLVGHDKLPRSISRFLVEDKTGYTDALKASGLSDTIISKIENYGTNIGLQPIETQGVTTALNGKSGNEIFNDYRNISVLSSYKPLNLIGFDWIILSEIDEEEAFSSVNNLRGIVIILTLILVIIAAISIRVFVAHILIKPINVLLSAVNELTSGDGDLTKRLPDFGKDEIGQTASAFNQFVERLDVILTKIKVSTASLMEASSETQKTSQTVASGANQQAASVEETSAALEQMSASVKQNSDNAEETEDISVNAAKDMQQTAAVVEETVSAMNQIVDRIQIIDDIAYKTNLLSLNAAIEAARAGEHGKGFAVVANEVNKLAERSQKAASEIGELAKNSSQVADRAGELLKQVVPQVQQTSDLIQEIASASNEQATGIEQVTDAINQIESSTQQNASASEELASTAQDIAINLEQLNDEVAYFKTS